VEIDDASIVDNYDPLVAARVLHQNTESAAVPDDAMASDSDSIKDSDAVPEPVPAPEMHDYSKNLAGKKRKADESPANPAPRKKKASASLLEEE
jgi:hypothetical protein